MSRFVICLVLLVFTVIPSWAVEEAAEPTDVEPDSISNRDDHPWRWFGDPNPARTLPGGFEPALDVHWDRILFPWSEHRHAPTTIAGLAVELSQPEVSGKELAAQADAFLKQYKQHWEDRKRVADLLAKLAAAFEDKGEFAKALALYEQVWEEFPERQDLIGRIKREHALADVPIDLSTPEKAFASLKRALITYKLTAATFGITDASTILYGDNLARDRRHQPWGRPDIPVKLIESWPWPEPNVWLDAGRWYELLWGKVYVPDASLPATKAIDKMRRTFSVPFVLTPEARKAINDSEKVFTIAGRALPSQHLKATLAQVSPKLGVTERRFSLLVYHTEHDQADTFITTVIQDDPGVLAFPDRPPLPAQQGTTDPTSRLVFWDCDEVPEDWFVYADPEHFMEVLTAPIHVAASRFNISSTGDVGKYYGRAIPVCRCLRGYPLPGPWDGRPYTAAYYAHTRQLRRQAWRTMHFLDDRPTIVMLLHAELRGVKEHAKNRFVPDLGLESVIGLGARLGLWYDGDEYRFLLFDSAHERARWLDGEDWVDVPKSRKAERKEESEDKE